MQELQLLILMVSLLCIQKKLIIVFFISIMHPDLTNQRYFFVWYRRFVNLVIIT